MFPETRARKILDVTTCPNAGRCRSKRAAEFWGGRDLKMRMIMMIDEDNDDDDDDDNDDDR